jgi:predicted glycogen debranching enzyme
MTTTAAGLIGYRRGDDAPEVASRREWLVTNGMGGYASGTLCGVNTRRYHGLLVAALPNPLGRTMMFNQLIEWISRNNGEAYPLSGAEARALAEFRVEMGLPVWTYETEGIRIEKRLSLPAGQNTVLVTYRLVEGPPEGVVLHLRPTIQIRPHDAPVSTEPPTYTLALADDRFEVVPAGGYPPLRVYVHGDRAGFVFEPTAINPVDYSVEAARGYESRGTLWSRGRFEISLAPDKPIALLASVEAWDVLLALDPDELAVCDTRRKRRLLRRVSDAARDPVLAELVLAADQFVIAPVGRTRDTVRARASGDELRTVIAGYHWFTDWGRDTMISLEGLCLVTQRHEEALYILRTFARYVRNGLIPNLFPEGSHEGLYHTADATLWFFHAVDRYLHYTHDAEFLREIAPLMQSIVEQHVAGTRFHIGVDPDDGLLRQGEEGYQLTWMDAKCGDWVVTPRRGKAVEINALWYNALASMAKWMRELDRSEDAARFDERAARVRSSFNRRFWFEEGGYLYDVVDGPEGRPDAAIRPNQIFALSLPNPVLDQGRWRPVLDKIEATLLTPYGLRSLAPESPDYQPSYHGDLRTRDAAYHQGTVWAWLIGPYVQALLRVHPGSEPRARACLSKLIDHLGQACVGQVAEVFDAEAPFLPRGCVAQAWSVAELLASYERVRDLGPREAKSP